MGLDHEREGGHGVFRDLQGVAVGGAHDGEDEGVESQGQDVGVQVGPVTADLYQRIPSTDSNSLSDLRSSLFAEARGFAGTGWPWTSRDPVRPGWPTPPPRPGAGRCESGSR